MLPAGGRAVSALSSRCKRTRPPLLILPCPSPVTGCSVVGEALSCGVVEICSQSSLGRMQTPEPAERELPTPHDGPSSPPSAQVYTQAELTGPAGIHARDLHFMRLALKQAQLAVSKDEVPVGAVLVAPDGVTVLAATHNLCHSSNNPVAHAEMLAIQEAAGQQGGWRLLGTTLYVTLEPCPMCAGAILQARLGRVVYGARQPRLGADGSWVALLPGPSQGLNQGSEPRGVEEAWSIEKEQDGKQLPQGRGGWPRANAKGLLKGWQVLLTALASLVRREPEASEVKACQCVHCVPGQAGVRPVGPHPFHRDLTVTRGVLAQECGLVMRQFFQQQRAAKRRHVQDSGEDLHAI